MKRIAPGYYKETRNGLHLSIDRPAPGCWVVTETVYDSDGVYICEHRDCSFNTYSEALNCAEIMFAEKAK